MKRAAPATKPKTTIVARKQVPCAASGKTYDVTVTGFYDAREVLNVEFHYGDVDPLDDPELEAWQTAYVAMLGRRVP